jgi:hypothetical protein
MASVQRHSDRTDLDEHQAGDEKYLKSYSGGYRRARRRQFLSGEPVIMIHDFLCNPTRWTSRT